MTAIQTLLASLIDYAGLYPPASLSLRSAANNYLAYTTGRHAEALGRFIINADRLDELRSVAGESLARFELSVIASNTADFDRIHNVIRNGMKIEAIEMKNADLDAIKQTRAQLPNYVDLYIEIAPDASTPSLLQAMVDTGIRAKIRMGGVTPDAFPSAPDVVRMMAELARLRLSFKATAGLHHPIRSCRPLTYDQHSPKGTMHGFINLCCAAAVLFFGERESAAERILLEEDPSAWHIGNDEIQWRDLPWTRDQLSSMRRHFLTSIGSCSFEEPIHDLEALGWL